MRKWIPRLTFSFLVIALACGYEAAQGYLGKRPARGTSSGVLLAVVALAAFCLFLMAIKMRHRGEHDL